MRISTQMLYESGTSQMMDRSSELQKLQTQIATGRRVVTPSDDPIAASSALMVKRGQGYQRSIHDQPGGGQRITLATMESKLDSVKRSGRLRHMYDLLKEKERVISKYLVVEVKIILPSEIEELHAYGITKIYSP